MGCCLQTSPLPSLAVLLTQSLGGEADAHCVCKQKPLLCASPLGLSPREIDGSWDSLWSWAADRQQEPGHRRGPSVFSAELVTAGGETGRTQEDRCVPREHPGRLVNGQGRDLWQ